MIKWGLKGKIFDTMDNTMDTKGAMNAIVTIDTIFNLDGTQCSGYR